jgi:hypothetical protein
MLLLLVAVMASFDAFTTTTNAFVIPTSTTATQTAGFSSSSSLRVAVDTSEIKKYVVRQIHDDSSFSSP